MLILIGYSVDTFSYSTKNDNLFFPQNSFTLVIMTTFTELCLCQLWWPWHSVKVIGLPDKAAGIFSESSYWCRLNFVWVHRCCTNTRQVSNLVIYTKLYQGDKGMHRIWRVFSPYQVIVFSTLFIRGHCVFNPFHTRSLWANGFHSLGNTGHRRSKVGFGQEMPGKNACILSSHCSVAALLRQFHSLGDELYGALHFSTGSRDWSNSSDTGSRKMKMKVVPDKVCI